MADAPDGAAHDFAGLALVLRQRAAMTQRDVAARVGVSERTVRLWEDGLGHPGAALRGILHFEPNPTSPNTTVTSQFRENRAHGIDSEAIVDAAARACLRVAAESRR